MIDTGLEENVYEVFATLRMMNIRQLNGIFLTHTHKDHIGGLETILNNFPVEKVYRAAISQSVKSENKIDKIAAESGKTPELLNAGDTVTISGGSAFEVLAPNVCNEEDDNDNSLVLMLTVNGTRALFTGDMQFSEEYDLLQRNVPPEADILKIGNHGNPDASSADFLKAVSPAVSVFTTDRTVDEDSANERISDALRALGSSCFYTDETDMGVRIDILQDGTFQTELPERPVSAATEALVIREDREAQEIVFSNPGTAVIDLSGFSVFSETNGNTFLFPENSIITPGGSLSLSGTKGTGDLVFPSVKKLWSSKKDKTYLVRDAFGNLIYPV